MEAMAPVIRETEQICPDRGQQVGPTLTERYLTSGGLTGIEIKPSAGVGPDPGEGRGKLPCLGDATVHGQPPY